LGYLDANSGSMIVGAVAAGAASAAVVFKVGAGKVAGLLGGKRRKKGVEEIPGEAVVGRRARDGPGRRRELTLRSHLLPDPARRR
jgi:hypothetical protein